MWTRRSNAGCGASWSSCGWIGPASSSMFRPGPSFASAWAVEGVDRMAPILEAGRVPLGGRPAPAGRSRPVLPDRRAARRRRRSIGRAIRPWASGRALALPLSVRGSMLGVLSFDSLRAERDLGGRARAASAAPRRGLRRGARAKAPGAVAGRAAALRDTPVGAVGHVQQLVGDRGRSRDQAGASPDRRFLQGRLGQSGRALPRHPRGARSRTRG